MQKQQVVDKKQTKSIEDCEVELQICFDSVPQVGLLFMLLRQIFFDGDFDLSDPVMFSVVLDPNEHFKVVNYKVFLIFIIYSSCAAIQILLKSV